MSSVDNWSRFDYFSVYLFSHNTKIVIFVKKYNKKMALGRTAKYYKENPEAYAKKLAYQKKLNKKPSEVDRRVELNRVNRQNHAAGKSSVGDGKDVSHMKNGKTTLEKAKINRARQGSNGKTTKK
jgi:hypothetical protein